MTKNLLQKNKSKKSILRVAELFAGVGGFRLGLEGYQGKSATSNYQDKLKSPYQTIWSNQWEPSTKTQIASEIYINRFGTDGHVCKDISQISADDIPDHDLLMGGFPCQDYSIANVRAEGMQGKKGVLWWEIYRIIKEKSLSGKVFMP